MGDVQWNSREIDVEAKTEPDESTASRSYRRISVIILLPAITTAIFLCLFGVDIPYFDEWDLAPLVDLAARGEATFQDYYEQHGVHRILVPKYLLSQLAVATGWNVLLEMFINLGLVLATLPAFVRLSRRTVQIEDPDRTLISLAISMVLFAPIAVESWLSGWHLGWFLTNACVVWAIFIMTSPRPGAAARFGLSAILCLVASFSIAHGLASWLALIPAVAMSFRRKALALTVWGALFVLSVIVYFSGYVPRHPELPTSLTERLSTMILYFFAIIGSPVAGVSWIAIPAGVIFSVLILVFAVMARRRGQQHNALPWITVALYVFGFAAANALGRAGWGIERALSAPYKLVSALILIVLLHMALLVSIGSGKHLRAVRRAAWAIMAIMIVGALSILPHAAQQRSLRMDAALCLRAALLIDSHTPACRPALAWHYRDPVAETRRLHQSGVFDLPDHEAFTDEFARGRIDVESSGWERFGRSGRQFVIRGSFETMAANRTLLVLTTGDSPPHVIATQLESHPDRVTFDWTVEFPIGTAPSGTIRAWTYDERSDSFHRLRGEIRLPLPASGGPPI